MKSLVLLLLVTSPVLAVDWTLLPNADEQHAGAYAVCQTFPVTLTSFDEDQDGTTDAVAHAFNLQADAQSSIASIQHQVGAERRVAAALEYDCSAEADAQSPSGWAKAGATIRRVEVFKASEAGVMRGKFYADVLEGVNVPDNVAFLNMEIRVGKSTVSLEYHGLTDRWVLDGLRLWKVNAQGEEYLVDLSWMKIEQPGFTNLTGDPMECQENVDAGEEIIVEVAINTLPSYELRVDASTEPGEPNSDAGNLRLSIAGALINE